MRAPPRLPLLCVLCVLAGLVFAFAIAFPREAIAAEANQPNVAADGRVKVLAAMKDELSRSMEKLKLQGHDAPYFVSFQLKDATQHGLEAKYGALFSDDVKRDAKLYVDVRVGSYAFDSSEGADNSPFSFGGEGPTYYPSLDAPLDGDARALRNALWLATDAKYKAALSAWLKKKGQNVYEVEEKDKATSFTREAKVVHVQPPLPLPFDRALWRQRALELSRMFEAHPEIFDSEVRITADHQVRIQATSEGTELVTEEAMYAVHVQAVARAEDGQLLDNSRDFYSTTERELPSFEVMKAETKELVDELLALRKAPVIDPYTGPAILAPEATGVLFHETIGHRLEGERQDNDDEGRTFKGQVGVAVVPRFLSVIDDPTKRAHGKTPLNGHYAFDDEGVPAQKATLIDQGVLRSYILSRKPVKGFARSNGHGRAQGNRQPVARMANLVVESKKRVPYAKLRQMLLAEAKRAGKPYALIIKDITGGNTNTSTYGYQAFKGVPRLVYRVDVKTGKEELVRGVEIVGTPLTSINKIVATGDEDGIFNGYCGAESGYVPVSTVAPAALITELELQRTAKANEKPPVLPSPWSATK